MCRDAQVFNSDGQTLVERSSPHQGRLPGFIPGRRDVRTSHQNIILFALNFSSIWHHILFDVNRVQIELVQGRLTMLRRCLRSRVNNPGRRSTTELPLSASCSSRAWEDDAMFGLSHHQLWTMMPCSQARFTWPCKDCDKSHMYEARF